MGLFDTKQTDLNKTFKKLTDTYYMTMPNVETCASSVNNPELFSKILTKIEEMKADELTAIEIYSVFTDFYKIIVNNENDLSLFYKIVSFYLKDKTPKHVLLNMLMSFNDKNMVIELYSYLKYKVDDFNKESISTLISYLVLARQYFVDDRALFSSFINLCEIAGTDILNYGTEEDIKKIIDNKLKDDKKANGVYDIDEAALAEFDRKMEELGVVASKINTLIDVAEKQADNLKLTTQNISDEFSGVRIEELKKLREESNIVLKEFNATYLELLNKQNNTIISERDKLLAEISQEIEQKRIQLLRVADSITNTVGVEVTKINSASSKTIQEIESYVANSENVKRVLHDVKSNEDLMAKLAFVSSMPAYQQSRGQVLASQAPTKVVESSEEVQEIVIPKKKIITSVEESLAPVDYTVNYYFDDNVKYAERIKRLLDKKEKMAADGEIFHEKFDDIVAMIIKNDAPYMYGPSGCGKSYMVKEQLAKLFDVDIITGGYVQYEQDIIGYTNAGDGGYVPSNFYRAYRYGKPYFFDELDNSNANATIILNSFLTKEKDERYTFPNGVCENRHPNFRIICAGNTKGNGRTYENNTRQKLDESVMQRLTPIYVTYDNRIEKEILKDYPGWYEFAVKFRKAVESIPSQSGEEINSIGTFTTRDAETIRDYKNDNVFSDEKLIQYQIIENKDDDYLTSIIEKMDQEEYENKDAKKLLKLLKQGVENNHHAS